MLNINTSLSDFIVKVPVVTTPLFISVDVSSKNNETKKIYEEFIKMFYQNKEVNSKYSQLIKKLTSYSKLKNNWDGYNGVKPSKDIIQSVEKFLKILQEKYIIAPQIMVSGSGIIGLFWKNNEDYIEINFDLPNTYTFFYELNSEVYGEDDILVNQTLPKKLALALSYVKEESDSNIENLTVLKYAQTISDSDRNTYTNLNCIKVDNTPRKSMVTQLLANSCEMYDNTQCKYVSIV